MVFFQSLHSLDELYYTFKDLVGIFLFFLVLSIFLFYIPNFLGQCFLNGRKDLKIFFYNVKG